MDKWSHIEYDLSTSVDYYRLLWSLLTIAKDSLNLSQSFQELPLVDCCLGVCLITVLDLVFGVSISILVFDLIWFWFDLVFGVETSILGTQNET